MCRPLRVSARRPLALTLPCCCVCSGVSAWRVRVCHKAISCETAVVLQHPEMLGAWRLSWPAVSSGRQPELHQAQAPVVMMCVRALRTATCRCAGLPGFSGRQVWSSFCSLFFDLRPPTCVLRPTPGGRPRHPRGRAGVVFVSRRRLGASRPTRPATQALACELSATRAQRWTPVDTEHSSGVPQSRDFRR